MRGGEYAVENDRDVGEKFGNNVEGACSRGLLDTARHGPNEYGGESWRNVPHTVHRMNSIVASLSLTRFKLMAIADCPINIDPT